MNLHPWAPAVESQLQCLKLVTMLIDEDMAERKRPPRDLMEYLTRKNKSPIATLASGWRVDHHLLQKATPYMWSAETTEAVIAASQSIPLDTPLNEWNLSSPACWFYFEKSLPFMTVWDPDAKVKAIAFGKVEVKSGSDFQFGLPVVCWIPAPEGHRVNGLIPSQTFEWELGITLGEMLERTRANHIKRYGENGPDAGAPQVSLEQFMAACEGIARFILASLAWMKQKILVQDDQPIERHRRKEFEKAIKRTGVQVKVISLRKAERRPSSNQEEAPTREFSCRWMVGLEDGGFWRNQPCGPNMKDRRLTWILPFMKGPEDKPLRISTAKKVYTVDR
jgi:hypothetical protein